MPDLTDTTARKGLRPHVVKPTSFPSEEIDTEKGVPLCKHRTECARKSEAPWLLLCILCFLHLFESKVPRLREFLVLAFLKSSSYLLQPPGKGSLLGLICKEFHV